MRFVILAIVSNLQGNHLPFLFGLYMSFRFVFRRLARGWPGRAAARGYSYKITSRAKIG